MKVATHDDKCKADCVVKVNGSAVQEFATKLSGTHSNIFSSWIPVEAGQKVTLEVGCTVRTKECYFDLVVDGIVRNAEATKPKDWVEKRYVHKFNTAYDMVGGRVTEVDLITKDLVADAMVHDVEGADTLGCIEMRVWVLQEAGQETTKQATKTFENCAGWRDLAGLKTFACIRPAHEIEMVENEFNPLITVKMNNARKKTGGVRPGTEPWVVFRFFYRTQESINQAGLTKAPKFTNKNQLRWTPPRPPTTTAVTAINDDIATSPADSAVAQDKVAVTKLVTAVDTAPDLGASDLGAQDPLTSSTNPSNAATSTSIQPQQQHSMTTASSAEQPPLRSAITTSTSADQLQEHPSITNSTSAEQLQDQSSSTERYPRSPHSFSAPDLEVVDNSIVNLKTEPNNDTFDLHKTNIKLEMVGKSPKYRGSRRSKTPSASASTEDSIRKAVAEDGKSPEVDHDAEREVQIKKYEETHGEGALEGMSEEAKDELIKQSLLQQIKEGGADGLGVKGVDAEKPGETEDGEEEIEAEDEDETHEPAGEKNIATAKPTIEAPPTPAQTPIKKPKVVKKPATPTTPAPTTTPAPIINKPILDRKRKADSMTPDPGFKAAADARAKHLAHMKALLAEKTAVRLAAQKKAADAEAVRKADYDRAVEELKAQIEEEDMMIEEAEIEYDETVRSHREESRAMSMVAE